MARALAFGIGGFALLNAACAALTGFNANRWWIDAHPALVVAAGLALIAWALAPGIGPARRRITFAVVGVLAVVALVNAATFYVLLARGRIASGFPVPLSLGVAAALLIVLNALRRPPAPLTWRPAAVVAAALVVGFPLAQIACFGRTDYRRPADAIVVLGARAYADGRCSWALEDRVRTACELYREGRAPRLVMSGGPGDGDVHETEAMRRLAVRLGVPDHAIAVDREGLTTRATVRNTRATPGRLLVVSHFYHLPRIKMAYQREGVDVFTVPARSRPLTKMPWLLTREVAAWWAYYAGV